MYHSRSVVDRQVIAAVREHDALCQKRFTIIKLDQPIQRGWRRTYVLTEQAATRPDRAMLEAILEVIGTVVVHHRRDFLRRPGRQRKFVEIEQPLGSISIYEWERKDYPTKWFHYFRRELVLELNRHWQLRWVFTRPELFELKVERNWLWYFREVDPALETRLSELHRWLESHEGRQRYGWLTGRRQRYRWREEPSAKQKNLRYEHERETVHAIQIFPEVDPAPLAKRIRISRWSFIFPGVAQRRGNELRPRPVRVQVLPPAGPAYMRYIESRFATLRKNHTISPVKSEMRRLIDCTYLHGAARCLRGQALHFDDLTSFLRLVGEVLISDRILFTADPTGPVYLPALAAAGEISAAMADKTLLQHFEVDALDYTSACESAARNIAKDLKSMPCVTEPVGIVSPIFDASGGDPDAAFFFELREALGEHQNPDWEIVPRPANAARFVLTRPHVMASLRASRLLNSFSSESEFLGLTALVRAMVYRQIGAQLNALYLRATSRARLLAGAHADLGSIPRLLASTLNDTETSYLSLAAGVDAIVRASSGDPYEILRAAWAKRKIFLPIRTLLAPTFPGDALGARFQIAEETRKLTRHLNSIVSGEDGPFLGDCLELQFILFAIPAVTVHPGKLHQWLSRRSARSKIGQFADLLSHAKTINRVSAYDTLLHRAGIHYEAPSHINVTLDDRPPRIG